MPLHPRARTPWVSPQPSWPTGLAQLKPGQGHEKPELPPPHPGWVSDPTNIPSSSPAPHLTQRWTGSLCLTWGHPRTLTSLCWGLRCSEKDPGQLEYAVLPPLPVTHTPSSFRALLLCSRLLSCLGCMLSSRPWITSPQNNPASLQGPAQSPARSLPQPHTRVRLLITPCHQPRLAGFRMQPALLTCTATPTRSALGAN